MSDTVLAEQAGILGCIRSGQTLFSGVGGIYTTAGWSFVTTDLIRGRNFLTTWVPAAARGLLCVASDRVRDATITESWGSGRRAEHERSWITRGWMSMVAGRTYD